MANRRLISQAVVEDDDFLELSPSARLLYVYINLHCDDEGFCGRPKAIGRLAGFSSQELATLFQELFDSRFLISFDDGKVVAVTDWYRNNTLNSNRWSPTEYIQQRAQLIVNDNRRYELAANGNGLSEPFFSIHRKQKRQDNSVNHEVEQTLDYFIQLVPKPYNNLTTALQDRNIVSAVQEQLKQHTDQELKKAAKWTKNNRSPRNLSQLISSLSAYWI